MGEVLKKRLKQTKFENEAQEAALNLLVAANYLRTKHEEVCFKHNITGSQYNVLRILKGIYPDGYPRCEIIQRMIDPSPDVTRLIDRLEKERLVERFTSNEDRRLSISRITQKGITLLEEMKQAIKNTNDLVSSRLSNEDCLKLSELCEKLYKEEN